MMVDFILKLILLMVSIEAPGAFADYSTKILGSDTLSKIQDWLAKGADRVFDGHESTVHLVYDRSGHPVRTPYSILIVSGLYNSPYHMSALARHFAPRNVNILNMRLAGHYERDPKLLASKVEWKQWKEQTKEAFQLAKELGEKVVLVGHSTGASLLTWMAIEEPEQVGGMALFSPAFKVHPLSSMAAHATAFWSLYTWFGGRVVSGHAGVQVEQMVATLHSEVSFEEASRRLRHVPIWMANTKLDLVIDADTAERILTQLTVEGSARRLHYSISSCSLVLHDRIISPGTLEWSRLLESMDSVLPVMGPTP